MSRLFDGFPDAALERLRVSVEQIGVSLSPDQFEALAHFGARLIATNRRVNLTAITNPAEIVDRHFLDSLAVLAHPLTRDLRVAQSGGLSLVDVGAGAGLPGLPLAIAWPEVRVDLIEATAKKAAFIAETAEALGLANVRVLTGRAEELGHHLGHREQYQLGLARALAPLPVLLELTLPFIRPGGHLLLHKTWPWTDEVTAAQGALDRLGGAWGALPADPPLAGSPRRILLPVTKIGPTPATYPRRSGVPAKRPLR